MKQLKLFPKTFLVSIGLFAALIILVHALVYTLMPQFYLQQKEREAADNLTALTTKLRGKSIEEMRRLSQEFATMNNVNITLTIDGHNQYFQGFESINIVTDSGKSVDTSVVKIADGQTVDPRSVILRQGSVTDKQGRAIAVKLLADVAPVTQATLATLHVLPYTMLGSLLVALLFSYIYSRFVTRPIRQMAAVTTTMQRLEKNAHYPVNSSDEIGVLGRNINELYQNLWQTICSLEHENKRITQLEKEKIAFLRAASHELKTPLAALRIMLENMQLNIGEYKNRDRYLAESVAQNATRQASSSLGGASLGADADSVTSSRTLEKVTVGVQPTDLLAVWGAGLAVIIIAVLLASRPITQSMPKELLTEVD